MSGFGELVSQACRQCLGRSPKVARKLQQSFPTAIFLGGPEVQANSMNF